MLEQRQPTEKLLLDQNNLCRVLVLGDKGVGKSCLIHRFVTGQYNQSVETNTSTERHKLHFAARRRTRFLISESSSVPDSSLCDVDVVLLCFSLDSSVSLARVVSSWSSVSDMVTTVLVGTRSDIRAPHVNTYRQVMSIARQIKAVSYVETSAKMSYSSTAAAFESAAFSRLPQLSRQSSITSTTSMISPNRKHIKRDHSEPRLKPPASRMSSLNCLKPPSLSHTRRSHSSSSSSLQSKSSTLSSARSSSSILSVSTSHNKTPSLTRKTVRDKPEQMVTIKVERLNKDRQMEEVEIEIPVNVYQNLATDQLDNVVSRDSEFVRNCGKRNSLASKLRQLIVR